MTTTKTRTETMRAFHGDPALKASVLRQLAHHRRLDQIVQGTYWNESEHKGCAVGCLTHARDGDHSLFPELWGIPEDMAHLMDRIFEGLTVDEARAWPQKFIRAIPVGADLSLVTTRFRLWLLTDPKHGVRQYAGDPVWGVAAAIDQCAALLQARIDGREPTVRAWSAARSAASSAASSAWSAASSAWIATSSAWSAASSARSAASSAESAAWSAASSAESAAESAESAAESARSAACSTQATTLARLC